MLMIDRLAHVRRLCQGSALHLLLLCALLPLYPSTAEGQDTARTRLDPMWFASPLGRYSLEVDPTEPNGEGPANCTLRHEGKTVWKKPLPFTFRDAIVTDSGACLGTAYTEGLGMLEGGDLVVAIVGPDGLVRLAEHSPREAVRMHSPDQPISLGIVHLPESNRALVRVFQEPVEPEEWRVYDLATAKRVSTVVPRDPTGGPGTDVQVFDLRPLPGTPLLLVHWQWHLGFSYGAYFQVVDELSTQVWSLALRDDYEGMSLPKQTAWMAHCRHGGAIPVTPPGSFSVVRYADGKIARYGIRRDADREDGWVIQEVDRRPHPWSRPDTSMRISPPNRRIDLELLGEVVLETAAAEPETHVIDWRPTELGVEVIQRDDNWAPVWTKHRTSGEEIGRVPIPLSDSQPHGSWYWTRLSSGRWLCVLEPVSGTAKPTAWRFDPAAAEVLELKQFEFAFPDIQAIASTTGDGFALISMPGGRPIVAAFDNTGDELWRKSASSPTGLAFTAAGEVAVLSSGRELSFHALDDGQLLRTVDLDEGSGVSSNYGSDLEATPDGGVLVHDLGGAPNLWRISAGGGSAEGFRLSLANGHSPEKLANEARYSPDGRLWSCDGRAFLRFNDHGDIDLVVGQQVRSDRLEQPTEARAGPKDQLYVLDGLDGDVHVFDREGGLLHRCMPGPDDFNRVPYTGHVAVDGEGHVFVGRNNAFFSRQFIHSDANGNRIGIDSFPGSLLTFRPGSREAWVQEFDKLFQLGVDGQQTEPLHQREDRKLFRDIHGIAADEDGSVAVLGEELTILEQDGTPRVTHEIPTIGHECARGSGWLATGDTLQSIILTRESDGAQYSFVIDPKGTELYVDLTTPPGTDELWVFDRERRIVLRYAWPEEDK